MTRTSYFAVGLLLSVTAAALGDTTQVTVLKAGKLGGNLRRIDFPSATVGYAVGDDISVPTNNFAAKTTDGGLTWTAVSPPPVPDRPWAVKFLNPDTGFVGGYNGLLLRTTDGGSTWINVNNSGYTGNFNDIQFASPTLGWACGTLGGGTVIQTTDGGTIWSLVNVGNTLTRYSILPLNTSEVLISGGSGTIARTTNGGGTWGSSGTGWGTLYSLARVGANGVVVSGSQRALFKSTDRGGIFIPVLSQGGSGMSLYSVSMADSLNGFAVGSSGLNYRTRDGWTTVDSVLVNSFTAQVCRTTVARSSTEIFVGADQGNILRSTDFGNTWNTIESSTLYYALDFVDANNGVAVGWRGSVVKTTDGGTTWADLRGLSGFELYDVKMFTPDTFCAGGGAGRFYVTSDGGASFATRNLPYVTGDNVKTLSFFDPGHGYAAGENGSLYYTDNAGLAWNPVYSFGASFNDAEDVFFVSDSLGFAVGERGRVVRTRMRTVWDTVGIVRPTQNRLLEAQFLDSSMGYVVAENGGIFKTTNGGASWLLQTDTTGLSFTHVNDIHVVDPTRRGYAVARKGKLFRLSDASSWIVDRVLVTSYGSLDDLWGMDFVDSTRAFICGSYGTIYRLDVAATTWVSGNIAFPNAFALDQNYPNPFNPATTVEFRVQSSEFVNLRVYDVLGREVGTLVNGMKQPGRYMVHFDGSGLASGVFFCRLQAGSFVDTKKMLLAK